MILSTVSYPQKLKGQNINKYKNEVSNVIVPKIKSMISKIAISKFNWGASPMRISLTSLEIAKFLKKF